MVNLEGRNFRLHQYIALVIFTLCSLTPCLHCFASEELHKEVRQDSSAAKSTTSGVKTGRILFDGKDLKSDSKTAVRSVKEIDGFGGIYQADFPGWPKSIVHGLVQDAHSPQAQWLRMGTSLQCGQDQMTLKVVGPGASLLKLDRGATSPLPLTQVPSSCGYTLQRNPLGLVLNVPYNGCHMIRESGGNVLPMVWQGIPVKLSCPVSPTATTTYGNHPLSPQNVISHHLSFPAALSHSAVSKVVPQPVPVVPQYSILPQNTFLQSPSIHAVPSFIASPKLPILSQHSIIQQPSIHAVPSFIASPKLPILSQHSIIQQPPIHAVPSIAHPVFPRYPIFSPNPTFQHPPDHAVLSSGSPKHPVAPRYPIFSPNPIVSSPHDHAVLSPRAPKHPVAPQYPILSQNPTFQRPPDHAVLSPRAPKHPVAPQYPMFPQRHIVHHPPFHAAQLPIGYPKHPGIPWYPAFPQNIVPHPSFYTAPLPIPPPKHPLDPQHPILPTYGTATAELEETPTKAPPHPVQNIQPQLPEGHFSVHKPVEPVPTEKPQREPITSPEEPKLPTLEEYASGAATAAPDTTKAAHRPFLLNLQPHLDKLQGHLAMLRPPKPSRAEKPSIGKRASLPVFPQYPIYP